MRDQDLYPYATRSKEIDCRYCGFVAPAHEGGPNLLRHHVATDHGDSIRAYMYIEELRMLNRQRGITRETPLAKPSLYRPRG